MIEQTMNKYCARCGKEEFGTVLARNLNCSIQATTASTTHHALDINRD